MCKYELCGTNLESNSFCAQCGEPKCDDCASASSSRVHKSCESRVNNGSGPTTGLGLEPKPEPKVQPRPAGIINDLDGKARDRIL